MAKLGWKIQNIMQKTVHQNLASVSMKNHIQLIYFHDSISSYKTAQLACFSILRPQGGKAQ